MSSHESLSPNISRLHITLQHIKEKLVSLHTLKQENQSIQKERVSFFMFLQKSGFLGTLKGIEKEWIAPFIKFKQENHSLEKLERIEEACCSFIKFLEESHLLETLLKIEDHWFSFCQVEQECLHSRCIKIMKLIEEKSLSFKRFKRSYPRIKDEFRLLKLEFRTLDIILHLQRFVDEPYVSKKVHALIQDAVPDIGDFYYRQLDPWRYFHIHISAIKNIVLEAKLKIRAKCSFPKIVLELSTNEDCIVNPDIVVEFIDNVVKNLSDVLNFNYSSRVVFIPKPSDQIEKVLEELKFLRSFVCFVSDRCIENEIQHSLFTHVLAVAWYTTIAVWLYLSSGATSDERESLFIDLLQRRIQPFEPCICNIYIDVLEALKLEQSRWYPVIQIKYTVGCAVGFVETLLHHLEELSIFSNCTTSKEIDIGFLQEMLIALRSNLINLPAQALEFHLQEIDSVIVDAGIFVYSLYDNEKEKEETVMGKTNQELVLNFPAKIQRMQAVIYLITRRSFLLRSNLPRIEGLACTCTNFILDNLKEVPSLYSISIEFLKSQLQTTQKELKCFQAVVEQQDRLQHFAAQVTGLVYEVECIFDACKKKDVPEWCLFFWIFNIGEDIRVCMAEVAEIQEKYASNLVLHDTKDAASARTSSQFARNMNEEMLGLMDVMDELRDKLTEGSSDLDVISIVGMPGAGKTTLANKLYFDQSVVSLFSICAQCCVSQEYARKDLLLAILCYITEETMKLEREADDELADKLRKLLMRKRYLVLVDDVWETSAWDDLKLCFPEDNNGSRIILTTRHYDVATYAKHVSDPLVLRLLSNEESWMLLQNKVFNKESCPLVLEDVGKSIAQKCEGLPLSIVLVAGILARMEKEKHCWEQVAANLGPHIQAQSEHTIDLSYQNLPHHLRTCFLYFGVFSEDKVIQVSKLTWLWISEGFVKTHTEKLLEDIAKDYLENLVERNLVMVAKKSSDGKIKACRIHDLLLEFCRKKGKLENFLERIKGDNDTDPFHDFSPKCKTPRRLSLYSRCSDLAKWCLSFSHLTSFQFRESRRIAFSSIDRATYTFKRFKFLRVLDIEFTVIDSFPQELTLLRYLAFRTAEDTLSLPPNLWSVETLIVQGIKRQVSLPDTIWKMVKLRHLHIYDQAFFTLDNGQELLESSSTMDDLQTISSACFCCVDDANKILAKTPNLKKLRCEVSKFDGSFPAFNNLTMLKMLKITSGPTLTSINQLKLPSDLKKLALSNFHMHLNEVTMLKKLEVLKLLGVTISSNTWEVNAEQFSNLKFLKIENPSFSEWDVSDDAFPCLEHLVLKRCRYLKVIPSCFGYLPSLKSIEVKSCKESLIESAMVIKEMQVEEMGYSGFEVFIHE